MNVVQQTRPFVHRRLRATEQLVCVPFCWWTTSKEASRSFTHDQTGGWGVIEVICETIQHEVLEVDEAEDKV